MTKCSNNNNNNNNKVFKLTLKKKMFNYRIQQKYKISMIVRVIEINTRIKIDAIVAVGIGFRVRFGAIQTPPTWAIVEL